MDIYDRLEVIRKELGLSLSEMSKQLGYSHNQMYRLLHREIRLTPGFVENFYKTFNVNINYLLDGKGRIFVTEPKVYRKNGVVRRLKELRGNNDIRSYADMVGIYASNYKKIESGSTKLTEKSAEKIADANNVSVDWLLYGDELSKEDPVDKKMIVWLKSHPEQRKKIRKLMKNGD